MGPRPSAAPLSFPCDFGYYHRLCSVSPPCNPLLRCVCELMLCRKTTFCLSRTVFTFSFTLHLLLRHFPYPSSSLHTCIKKGVVRANHPIERADDSLVALAHGVAEDFAGEGACELMLLLEALGLGKELLEPLWVGFV